MVIILREYLLGNVAIARGILEAGAGVISGYPGTPSSEIVEHLAPLAKEHVIHVEWSVNEKVAMEVALGASASGRRSVVLVKHLGVNLLSDPLSIAPSHSIGAGLVVLVGGDGGAEGSQAEMAYRNYGHRRAYPLL